MESSGAYVSFIDDDDLYPNLRIEIFIKVLVNNKCVFIYSGVKNINLQKMRLG